jgi:DNA-binding NarL/FixJ family response regulator
MNDEMMITEIGSRTDLPLTNREKEILRHLSLGLQYKEIAYKLHISCETVKSHVTNIYSKLKVNNRTEAIIRYLGLNE